MEYVVDYSKDWIGIGIVKEKLFKFEGTGTIDEKGEKYKWYDVVASIIVEYDPGNNYPKDEKSTLIDVKGYQFYKDSSKAAKAFIEKLFAF